MRNSLAGFMFVASLAGTMVAMNRPAKDDVKTEGVERIVESQSESVESASIEPKLMDLIKSIDDARRQDTKSLRAAISAIGRPQTIMKAPPSEPGRYVRSRGGDPVTKNVPVAGPGLAVSTAASVPVTFLAGQQTIVSSSGCSGGSDGSGVYPGPQSTTTYSQPQTVFVQTAPVAFASNCSGGSNVYPGPQSSAFGIPSRRVQPSYVRQQSYGPFGLFGQSYSAGSQGMICDQFGCRPAGF